MCIGAGMVLASAVVLSTLGKNILFLSQTGITNYKNPLKLQFKS